MLALARKYPGISRRTCARMLEVSGFTASRVAEELIGAKMIREGDPAPEGPARGRGRPSMPLYLNPDADGFAGIDIEARWWRFVVIDFAGKTCYEATHPFEARRSRDEYVDRLRGLLEGEIAACGRRWGKVSAVGIGAPGILDRETGLVEEYRPLTRFERIPLLDVCRMVTNKPTFVSHNHVTLAASDLWLRPHSEHESTFHAVVRSGIGGVLTDRGRLFCGSHGTAGELGRLPVDVTKEGNRLLEDVSGLRALRTRLPKAPTAFWRGDEAAVASVWGKKRARETLTEAMTVLGRALAGAAILLDPDRFVVHSPILREDNALWPVLSEAFNAGLGPVIGRHLRLRASTLPEEAAAIGAALLAMERKYPTTAEWLSVPGG
jgi:predicted NBD/HSP70 family sugar kinase